MLKNIFWRLGNANGFCTHVQHFWLRLWLEEPGSGGPRKPGDRPPEEPGGQLTPDKTTDTLWNLSQNPLRLRLISGKHYYEHLGLTKWKWLNYIAKNSTAKYLNPKYYGISTGPPLGGAARLRGPTLSPRSSVSALSPNLRLCQRNSW